MQHTLPSSRGFSPVHCLSASRMSMMSSLTEVEVLPMLRPGSLDSVEMNPMPTRGSPSPSNIAQNGQRQNKNNTPNEHGRRSVHIILSRMIKLACYCVNGVFIPINK